MKTLFLLLLPISLSAQKLEHTDVVLFSLSKNTAGQYAISDPHFLTAFNRSGYNNQPAFFPGNEIYLSVQEAPDTTQTDIFALQPSTHTRTRVTATPSYSEFSPTPMPDGRSFSAVRTEPDGSQRLWKFPIDRSGQGAPLFQAIRNVGYHCWINDTLAALFLVGEPNILVVASVKGQKTFRIGTDPGRSLQRTPDGKLAFVQKATPQVWFLKVYDPALKTSAIVANTLPQCEDFAVLPDGSFLSANGPKLYHLVPGNNQAEWREIADLSKYNIRRISRIAVQGSQAALVVE